MLKNGIKKGDHAIAILFSPYIDRFHILLYLGFMLKFSKKQILLCSLALACLVFLIYMLIFPLGFLSDHYYVYFQSYRELVRVNPDAMFDRYYIDTPFTVLGEINIPQLVVFIAISIVLITLVVLLVLDLRKNYVHRPTKAERIAALEKQVAELKEQQNGRHNE